MSVAKPSVIIFLGMFAACSDGGSQKNVVPQREQLRPHVAETTTFKIEPFLTGCMGIGPQSCMLVTRTTEQVPGLFYEGIDGFEFEWGQRVGVVVEVETESDPAADQPTRRYRLREVTSRVSVGPDEKLTLRVYPDNVVWKEAESDGEPEIQALHGLTSVSCIDSTACAALRGNLSRPESSEEGVALKVGFTGGPQKPLVILEIID